MHIHFRPQEISGIFTVLYPKLKDALKYHLIFKEFGRLKFTKLRKVTKNYWLKIVKPFTLLLTCALRYGLALHRISLRKSQLVSPLRFDTPQY